MIVISVDPGCNKCEDSLSGQLAAALPAKVGDGQEDEDLRSRLCGAETLAEEWIDRQPAAVATSIFELAGVAGFVKAVTSSSLFIADHGFRFWPPPAHSVPDELLCFLSQPLDC